MGTSEVYDDFDIVYSTLDNECCHCLVTLPPEFGDRQYAVYCRKCKNFREHSIPREFWRDR